MKLQLGWTLALLMCGPLTVGAQEKPKQDGKETVVNGELNNTDVKDKVRTGSYCKTYTYKMKDGGMYQIDLMSADFDCYLRLENPKGDQVASDDDGGEGLNSRITFKSTATGDFTVVVTTFGGDATGKFKLIIKDLTPAAAGGAIEIKNEKGSGAYTGVLAANDVKYKDKENNAEKISKIFSFKMEEGKTYQIDHMAKGFDAYLYLEDADGKVLAQDDDGGDGLNSRIVHRAEKTGTYRIIATSLAGNRTGEFRLTVRQNE